MRLLKKFLRSPKRTFRQLISPKPNSGCEVCEEAKPKEAWFNTIQKELSECYPAVETVEADADLQEVPECFQCLWPFFRFCRVFGMCPISRHRNKLVASYRIYRPCWYPTLIALPIHFLLTSMSIQETVNVMGTNIDRSELVDHYNDVIYYLHDLGNLLISIWNIHKLPRFLAACAKAETMCRKYAEPNDGLVLHCNVLFYFLAFAQALGNAIYYRAEVSRNNVTTIGEFFAVYSTDILGSSLTLATGVIFSVGTTVCDISWTFGDFSLALISVILTRYFVRMNGELKRRRRSISLEEIEQLRGDYRELYNLIKVTNDIFAPLFLLTFLANAAYLLTRLFTGVFHDLTARELCVVFESIYEMFQQIFIKILIPSFLAANLNSKVQEGMSLIQCWPAELSEQDTEDGLVLIGRFISHFRSTLVGISGCGYFYYNKAFLVTIVSALLSYEIIIVQFQVGSNSNSKSTAS